MGAEFELRELYQIKFHPKVFSVKKVFVAHRSSVEHVTVGSVLQVPIVLSNFLLGHKPNSVFLVNLSLCIMSSMVFKSHFFVPRN